MSETKKYLTLSLTEAGKHDAVKDLKSKLTGWGIICKSRTGENSNSQRRKRNRKGQ